MDWYRQRYKKCGYISFGIGLQKVKKSRIITKLRQFGRGIMQIDEGDLNS